MLNHFSMTKVPLSTPADGQFYLGLDIGSVSLNTVLLDEHYNIVEDYYDYVHGKPFDVLHRASLHHSAGTSC